MNHLARHFSEASDLMERPPPVEENLAETPVKKDWMTDLIGIFDEYNCWANNGGFKDV